MNPHPISALIRRHMTLRNVTRRELAIAITGNGDRAKAFRRLDQMLSGERFTLERLSRVIDVLSIPREEIVRLAEEIREFQHAEFMAMVRQRFEFWGPHLWARWVDGYHPSLITVIGPAFFKLAKVSPELLELPFDEELSAVAEIARHHYRTKGARHIASYDYRRSVEEEYRLDVEGRFLEFSPRWRSIEMTGVRIGSRWINTSGRGFLRLLNDMGRPSRTP